MNITIFEKKLRRCLIFLFIALVFPGLSLIIVANYYQVLTLQEIFAMLIHPILLSWQVFAYLLAPVLIFVTIHFYRKYKDVAKNLKQLNKLIKITSYIIMSLPVLLNFFTPFIVYATGNALGIETPLLTFIFNALGLTLTISTLFMLLGLTIYEKALYWIPLESTDILVTLQTKNILVLVFSMLGLMTNCIAPLFLHERGDLDTYIKNILPFVPLSIIVGIFNMFILSHTSKNTLKRINEGLYSLAKKNYRLDSLCLESRDEYGLLITNFNIFHKETHLIFQDLTKSLTETNSSAIQTLNAVSKVKFTSKNISNRILAVKKQTENQASTISQTNKTSTRITAELQGLDIDLVSQGRHVTEASVAVEEMIANIKAVSETLDKNSNLITTLTTSSEMGLDLVHKTVDISEQVYMVQKVLLKQVLLFKILPIKQTF